MKNACYGVHTSPEQVGEFSSDENGEASNPIISEALSPSDSELQDDAAKSAVLRSCKLERRKGGPVFRLSADFVELIVYEQHNSARLSRAIRRG